MNKQKMRLIFLMQKNGDRSQELARAIGVSRSCFSAKINGKSNFNQREIRMIKERYSLSPEDLCLTFFGGDE